MAISRQLQIYEGSSQSLKPTLVQIFREAIEYPPCRGCIEKRWYPVQDSFQHSVMQVGWCPDWNLNAYWPLVYSISYSDKGNCLQQSSNEQHDNRNDVNGRIVIDILILCQASRASVVHRSFVQDGSVSVDILHPLWKPNSGEDTRSNVSYEEKENQPEDKIPASCFYVLSMFTSFVVTKWEGLHTYKRPSICQRGPSLLLRWYSYRL